MTSSATIRKNGTGNVQGIVEESCIPDFKAEDKIQANEQHRKKI
jgi:hypothetical protein